MQKIKVNKELLVNIRLNKKFLEQSSGSQPKLNLFTNQ